MNVRAGGRGGSAENRKQETKMRVCIYLILQGMVYPHGLKKY